MLIRLLMLAVMTICFSQSGFTSAVGMPIKRVLPKAVPAVEASKIPDNGGVTFTAKFENSIIALAQNIATVEDMIVAELERVEKTFPKGKDDTPMSDLEFGRAMRLLRALTKQAAEGPSLLGKVQSEAAFTIHSPASDQLRSIAVVVGDPIRELSFEIQSIQSNGTLGTYLGTIKKMRFEQINLLGSLVFTTLNKLDLFDRIYGGNPTAKNYKSIQMSRAYNVIYEAFASRAVRFMEEPETEFKALGNRFPSFVSGNTVGGFGQNLNELRFY